MANVQALLQTIADTQTVAIDTAATAIVRALRRDGLLYLFGTGHSHMLCEEATIAPAVWRRSAPSWQQH
jgi:uncharacterized phosphosugar-binding protein